MSLTAKSNILRFQFKIPYLFENVFFDFFMRSLHCVRVIVSYLFGGECCLCCGKNTLVMPLCISCCNDFYVSSMRLENRCEKCGTPLVSEIGICSACRNSSNIKSMERVFPLQTYKLWKKNLLFSWKLAEKRTLSPFFAWLVEKKIEQIERIVSSKKEIVEKFAVVPVPPRPGKLKKNGWDQINELCFYMHHGFGRKILPILERRNKIQQKKLGRIERLETIGKSYFPISGTRMNHILKKFDGKIPKTVILLDDIMTTGATLEDCADVLKRMGIEHIFGVSIFIVR